MNDDILEKYAALILDIGVNMQKNQYILISANTNNTPFVNILTEQAYLRGAAEVIVKWVDDKQSLLKYRYCNDSVFNKVSDWEVLLYDELDGKNSCYIGLNTSNRDLFVSVPYERIKKEREAVNHYLGNHSQRLNSFQLQWVSLEMPTKVWANKVFEDFPLDKAYEKLTNIFIKANRLDYDDPSAFWREHIDKINNRTKYLNELKLSKLLFKSSNGTNLSIELPNGHKWIGGIVNSITGISFTPNLPTEEVFTVPDKYNVNGRVVITKPFCYKGKIIKEAEFEFRNGRIIDYSASENEALIGEIIETDLGARYMGEIALVPNNTPIAEEKILLYNTLYDENASCHFALGRAYPACMNNFENLSKESMDEIGINSSSIHMDLMFGTDDLSVIAYNTSDEKIEIFVDGNFI